MRPGSTRTLWRAGGAALVALALGMIGPLSTAFAQDAGSSPAEPVTLTMGFHTDIQSPNPFLACCGIDYEFMQLVYDLGIGFNNEDLTPSPMIITDWTPDSTSMNWTLKVRDDATWSDGEKLTAEDVAFTFSFIADNQLPYFKDYLPFSPTFEAPDETTVIWHSTEPTFAPTVPPYIPILPEHIWKPLEKDDPKDTRRAVKEFPNDNPVGSGPFVLTGRSEGQSLHFHVNPNYWGGQPKSLTDIEFKIYDNQEALTQALKSGEVDIVDDLSPALYNSLKNNPEIGLQPADAGCWGNFAFNFGGQAKFSSDPSEVNDTHHPAVEDLRVRQAVSYSINREALIDKVYQGTASVAHSVLVPGKNGAYYTDIPEKYQYNYDPDKANQILDDAGYKDTDGDGIREMPDGTDPLNWDILVLTDVVGSVETGQLLQGYLAAIGIGMTPKPVTELKAGDLWKAGDYDAYVWDWCPDPDPDFLMSVFTTDQCLSWSDGCYSDPAYDKLYEQQRSTLDRTKRTAIIHKMEIYLAKTVPTLVLNYWSDLQAYRLDGFTGYVKSPDIDRGLLILGWTTQTYFDVTPVGTTVSAKRGLPAWIWLAGIGVLVVIGGLFRAMRRRGAEDEA